MELMTVKAIKAAIKKAKEVVVTPSFGNSESWVKIAKAEAIAFVDTIPTEATPEEMGMYGGSFGTFENGTVFLG